MTDWKKKAEALPHFAPAHEKQGASVDKFLDQIPGLGGPTKKSFSPASSVTDGGWGKEMSFAGNMIPTDPEALKALLMQRAMQQSQNAPQPAQMPSGAPEAPQSGATTVYLREGHNAFRQIQGGDAPIDLAIHVGPISGVTGKEFRLVGEKRFLVVEQQQRLDLSNIDYNRMVRLFVVEAPFIGRMLVPESAVIKRSPSGPQVLRD